MFIKRTLAALLCSLILVSSMQSQAQDLPGVEVSDASVSQNAKTLISLAAQQIPELFANGTPWRSLDGFFFKYFAVSGIFVGITGDDLYLLGGQFGDVATYGGKVADAIVVLGGASTGGPLFNDITTPSTLNALIAYFKTITVKLDTISTLAIFNNSASVAHEVQGQETVAGKATTKLQLTLAGSNLAQPVPATLWVDETGFIAKLIYNGTEFASPTSNTIGVGLVSSMLLALKSAESAQVQAALAQELASPAVDTKIVDNVISGLAVKTLAIEVSANPSATILFEVSDFGPFSIMTKYASTLAGTTTKFELQDIVLR